MELYPGFSLYRGLYELSKFAQGAFKIGTYGMYWEYLSSSSNGMREVLIIMSVEWVVFLIAAYYLDQVISSETGNRRSPLFFLPSSQKKHLASFQKPSFQSQESSVQMEDNDVLREVTHIAFFSLSLFMKRSPQIDTSLRGPLIQAL